MSETIERFQTLGRPTSFDPATGRFTAILATNVALDRGDFIEVLDLDEIGRAGWPERIPLQADHSLSVHQTLGDFSNLRMETLPTGLRALVADGELTEGPHTAAVAANLKAGKQRGVSINFRNVRLTEGKDDRIRKPIRVVSAGALVEASLVVEGADPNSTVRSEDMTTATQPAPPPANTPPPTPATEPARGGLTPDQIETLARSAGASEDVIRSVKESDASDSDKFAMILASVENRAPARSSAPHNETSLDNPAVLRTALIEGFDAVIRGAKPEGNAAALLGEGDAAIARRILRAAGENVIGLSDETVKRNAAATGDFAIIGGATFNLSMRREFEAVRSPAADLFGRDTVATFNPETRALVDWTTLAMGPKLENGEYKSSYIDESGEEVSVTVRGGITAISWELSINAVGRLGNIAQKQGRRYAADQADQQVAFLEQNAGAGRKMSDGHPVFHAPRGNIEAFTPGVETSIAQLFTLRSKMARRKGAGGVMIGDYPTHWLVHPDFEETALRLLASITASSVADVNPLAGKLTIVVEPRLSRPDRSWLVVEPSKMDGAVRVFLRGHEAPFTDSRQNWDTDALEFKIRHAFGLGWLEWRSWTRLDHG